MDCTTQPPALPQGRVRHWLAAFVILLGGCSLLPTENVYVPLAAEPFPAIHVLAERTAPTLKPQLKVLPPPSLWPELRQGMVLDHHLSHKFVKAELRWLRRNPNYFLRLGPRFSKYQAHIVDRVEARGLPAELALIPLVESALNPYAMSPDGAHGIWQFMPATATRFGLQRDWWQDARRDPQLATEAALDYLEYLYKRFDDWLLAVAAYNAGEGRVRKALHKANRRHGKPVRDFFKLELPRETRTYVPRILAISAAVKNPGKHNVKLPDVHARVPFRTVHVDGQYDLNVAANALQVDPSEIRAWNPSLKRWATPPLAPHASYPMVLPRWLDVDPQLALAAVPESERLKWHRVTVRRGDTISGIARRFGTSVAAVRSSNNLRSDLIRVNAVLKVPAGGKHTVAAAGHPQTHTYRVRRGDTPWRIGRRFGVSYKSLMRLNGIAPSDVLRIGQRIQVPFDGLAQNGVTAGG